MARKKYNQKALPFPHQIDRDYFGSWLSGFTDGEGCFFAGLSHDMRDGSRSPYARFEIGLRIDDVEVLKLIQSFFGCGIIKTYDRLPIGKYVRIKAAHFMVLKSSDLITKIIPHFESKILFAKKKRDFVIWKSIVELVHKVVVSKRRKWIPKWSKDNIENFMSLSQSLRDVRKADEKFVSIINDTYAGRAPLSDGPDLLSGLD